MTYRDYVRKIETLVDQREHLPALEMLKQLHSRYEKEIQSDKRKQFDFWTCKGLSHYHLDQFEDALPCFDNILNIWPNSPNVLFMRAKCYDYLDKLNQAERDYRQVIKLDSSAPCAHCFLGLVLESKGELNEAKKIYAHALKVDPTDSVSSERLAELQ